MQKWPNEPGPSDCCSCLAQMHAHEHIRWHSFFPRNASVQHYLILAQLPPIELGVSRNPQMFSLLKRTCTTRGQILHSLGIRQKATTWMLLANFWPEAEPHVHRFQSRSDRAKDIRRFGLGYQHCEKILDIQNYNPPDDNWRTHYNHRLIAVRLKSNQQFIQQWCSMLVWLHSIFCRSASGSTECSFISPQLCATKSWTNYCVLIANITFHSHFGTLGLNPVDSATHETTCTVFWLVLFWMHHDPGTFEVSPHPLKKYQPKGWAVRHRGLFLRPAWAADSPSSWNVVRSHPFTRRMTHTRCSRVFSCFGLVWESFPKVGKHCKMTRTWFVEWEEHTSSVVSGGLGPWVWFETFDILTFVEQPKGVVSATKGFQLFVTISQNLWHLANAHKWKNVKYWEEFCNIMCKCFSSQRRRELETRTSDGDERNWHKLNKASSITFRWRWTDVRLRLGKDEYLRNIFDVKSSSWRRWSLHSKHPQCWLLSNQG